MTTLTKEITTEEAEQRTNDHKRDFSRLERGWVRLGRDVEESVRLGVPGKLGKTMRTWLADTFEESASHIFRSLQSYRALKGVDEATLLAIPEANAHELVKLTEKDRRDPQIVSQAVSQKPKDFKETVAKIRAQKYGITPSEWRTFALRCPKDVHELLMAAQQRAAEVLSIDLEDEEKRPVNLITIWEGIAQMVIDSKLLKAEMIGDADANASD